MLTLYSGTGAQDFSVGEPALTGERWTKVRSLALRWLERRGYADSVANLTKLPFRLFEGHNGFGDEFTVLHAEVPFDQYMVVNESIQEEGRFAFSGIASAFSEASGTYVRFVSLGVDDRDTHEPVDEPEIVDPSLTVHRALGDVRELLLSRGATSAVDRLHTAFHGFLKEECTKASIVVPGDPAITALFKALRKQHPKFKIEGPESTHVERMLYALATIADASNPLRNRATLAHANPALLEEPEALLVVNSIKTLFKYVHDKLGAA